MEDWIHGGLDCLKIPQCRFTAESGLNSFVPLLTLHDNISSLPESQKDAITEIQGICYPCTGA